MTSPDRTLGSPLSSPQIQPLDVYENAGRLASSDDDFSLASFPSSPPARIEHIDQPRAAIRANMDMDQDTPKATLFQLLQKHKKRDPNLESDEDAEFRRRSSVFGLGLFQGLPEEDRLEQLRAQEDFTFECPACGNEDVTFWSRGRTAGQAECQSSTCGHRWMWKPTTKMVREGTTFEPNMPLPPKPSPVPALKRRKLKGSSPPEMMPPPRSSRGVYGGASRQPKQYASYHSKAPRRIPPEVSLDNESNLLERTSMSSPGIGYPSDSEFYEQYERFFSGRESGSNASSERPMPFPATKFPEPTEKPKVEASADIYPLDEEDEIYQSELLELELRRREIEARRAAHRARKSQLLLQQRREQLREQSLRRHRQALKLGTADDDDNDSLVSSHHKSIEASASDNSKSDPSMEPAENHAQPVNNDDLNKPDSPRKNANRLSNESGSDKYMFSDEEQEPTEIHSKKRPSKERKTVKPVIQMDERVESVEEEAGLLFNNDDEATNDDRMIEQAHGFYFSDEDEDEPFVPSGNGVRKQPIWRRASDADVTDEEAEQHETLSSDNDEIRREAVDVTSDTEGTLINPLINFSETPNASIASPPKKKRGRPTNLSKGIISSNVKKVNKERPPNVKKVHKERDPNIPHKKRGRKPHRNKKEVRTKKPMNSFNPYILFNSEMRKQMTVEHLGSRPGDISKMISQKWKAMTKEEKQKYSDLMNQKRRETGFKEYIRVGKSGPKDTQMVEQ